MCISTQEKKHFSDKKITFWTNIPDFRLKFWILKKKRLSFKNNLDEQFQNFKKKNFNFYLNMTKS